MPVDFPQWPGSNKGARREQGKLAAEQGISQMFF